MRAYLDTCVVIYFVEEVEQWIEQIRVALEEHAPWICVSELVRLEARIGPLRKHDVELDDRFERFLEEQEVVVVSREAFEHATRLRAEHNLKTPDALHIGAALAAGCDEFWTNDHRLDRVPLSLAVRVFDE